MPQAPLVLPGTEGGARGTSGAAHLRRGLSPAQPGEDAADHVRDFQRARSSPGRSGVCSP
jgi:hypothetical protein